MRFKKKLRDRKRELELERVQFVKKGKRALQRKAKQTETDPESCDVDVRVDQLHMLLVQLSNSGLHHLPHHQCPQTARESRISTYFRFLVPPRPVTAEKRCVFAKLCTAKQMKYKLGSNTWFHGECVNTNEPEKFFCASCKMSFCKSVKCEFVTVLCFLIILVNRHGDKKWEGVVTG